MRTQDDADPRATFHELGRAERVTVIKRMASDGYTDYAIAAATGLSVEMVREIIGQRVKSTEQQR